MPGWKGGPGRPPGSLSIRAALKAKLGEEHPDHRGKTYLDVIVENAANGACTADVTDVLRLIEALEGKAKGEDERPREIIVRRVDRGLVQPSSEPDEGEG